MCFSATSSFAASGLLVSIGLLAVQKSKCNADYMRAVVPFGFALQQCAEGVIWLTVGYGAYASIMYAASYLFLFFAFAVWPFWVPFTLWFAESDRKKRSQLFLLCSWGVLVLSYAFYLFFCHSFKVRIVSHSIMYDFGRSYIEQAIHLLCYAVATVVPFFVSSLPYASIFGALVGVALVVTYFLWWLTFVSVWCFFVALLSVLVLASICCQKP